eukprot:Lankesteria_metandrocarpae@DN7634_c0_g1_i1.p2
MRPVAHTKQIHHVPPHRILLRTYCAPGTHSVVCTTGVLHCVLTTVHWAHTACVHYALRCALHYFQQLKSHRILYKPPPLNAGFSEALVPVYALICVHCNYHSSALHSTACT